MGTEGAWFAPDGEIIPLDEEAQHANMGRFQGKNGSQLLREGYIRQRGNGVEIHSFDTPKPDNLARALEQAGRNSAQVYVDTSSGSLVYDTEGLKDAGWSLREVRPTDYWMRSEAGSAPMLVDLARTLSERFGKDAPKVNYSALGAMETRYRRNLGQIRRASPEVQRAALRTAASASKSRTILRGAIPAILKQLKGGDYTWPEVRLALAESRLRGIRDRWERFAGQVEEMSDQDLERSFDGQFAGLLSAIEGKRGLADDIAQTATAFFETQDWDGLRSFLAPTFTDAANSVLTVMEPAWYDAVTNDPKVQGALRIYKDLVEKTIAENHALNEGIFSDALGPLDTYYPLIPLDTRPASAGPRVAYKKPRNIANKFATGLAQDYDIGMEAFQQRLSRAIRGNDKAALLRVMEEEDLLQEATPGQDTIVWNGVEYKGVTVPVAEARTLLKEGKATHLLTPMKIMPAWLHEELKPILENEPLSSDPSLRIVRALNTFSLVGPLDFVWHSRNVMGALISNTPFLGTSLKDKALSLPLVKTFAAVWKVLAEIDPTTPENITKLLEMADVGALPSKSGAVTFSKEYAETTGAKRKFTLAPILYGPKGLDTRARILMWDIAKAMFPNESEASKRSMFVNQLGNYTPELWSAIERDLKKWGVAPFYTAGSTMWVNGVNSWIAGGPMPKDERAKWIMYKLTAGALGALAMWVTLYYLLTGKWPTEDKRAKLFSIPVGGGNGPIDKYRYSKVGILLWGNGPGVGYLSVSLFNPLVVRGARALGLTGAFETRQLGGSLGQQLEAAQRDAINSLVHPAAGPVPRSAFAGVYGIETYLTGFREPSGRWKPQWFPAFEPKTGAGLPAMAERMRAASEQLNPFFGNLGEALGESTGFLAPVEKQSQGNRYLRQTLDLVAPGLVVNASNPFGRAEVLRKQRQAEKRWQSSGKPRRFGAPAFGKSSLGKPAFPKASGF